MHSRAQHKGTIFACAHYGDYVVTAGYDQTIKLWKVSSGQLLYTLQAHNHIVSALEIAPSESIFPFACILSGSWDKTVKVWNLCSGNSLRCLEGHTNRVRSVKLCRGKLIASGSDDGSILLWDAFAGAQVLRIDLTQGLVLSLVPIATQEGEAFPIVSATSGTSAAVTVWAVNTSTMMPSRVRDIWGECSALGQVTLTDAQVAALSSLFDLVAEEGKAALPLASAASISPQSFRHSFALIGSSTGVLSVAELFGNRAWSLRVSSDEDTIRSICASDSTRTTKSVVCLSAQGVLGIVRWHPSSCTLTTVDLRHSSACKYSLSSSLRPKLHTTRHRSEAKIGSLPLESTVAMTKSLSARNILELDKDSTFHCCCCYYSDNSSTGEHSHAIGSASRGALSEGAWQMCIVGGSEGLLLCHPIIVADSMESTSTCTEKLQTPPTTLKSPLVTMHAASGIIPPPQQPVRPPLPVLAQSSDLDILPTRQEEAAESKALPAPSFWVSIDSSCLSFTRSRQQVRAQAAARSNSIYRAQNHRVKPLPKMHPFP